MLSTILVPLDGSALAEHALPFAERIARAARARVILTRAVPAHSAGDAGAGASVALAAREHLEDVASRLRQAEVSVDLTLPQGDPAGQIVGAVAPLGVDLVVMSTHGRSGIGRWLYGSVADAVMRSATVSLLLIPPELGHEWATERRTRILVPLDGSQHSEAVLGPVVDLAEQLGARERRVLATNPVHRPT